MQAETSALSSLKKSAEAVSQSSAGGLLLGATSTQADVSNHDTVQAQLLSDTSIGSSGSYAEQINVISSSNVDIRSEANSAAGGLIGAGASFATSSSDTTIETLVGDVTVYASEMNVLAGEQFSPRR